MMTRPGLHWITISTRTSASATITPAWKRRPMATGRCISIPGRYHPCSTPRTAELFVDNKHGKPVFRDLSKEQGGQHDFVWGLFYTPLGEAVEGTSRSTTTTNWRWSMQTVSPSCRTSPQTDGPLSTISR